MNTTRTSVLESLGDAFLNSSSLAVEIEQIASEMGDTLAEIDRLIQITRIVI